MSSAVVIASGYVESIFWDKATLRVIPLNQPNGEQKEQRVEYQIEKWEWYAAQQEPTFDVVRCHITSDGDIASAFDIGDEGMNTIQVVWRADASTYQQHFSDDDMMFDGSEIELTMVDADSNEISAEDIPEMDDVDDETFTAMMLAGEHHVTDDYYDDNGDYIAMVDDADDDDYQITVSEVSASDPNLRVSELSDLADWTVYATGDDGQLIEDDDVIEIVEGDFIDDEIPPLPPIDDKTSN